MRSAPLLVALTVAATVSGCGMLESKKVDYQSAAQRPASTLAVPPDLVSPNSDNRYAVPKVEDTNASDFERSRTTTTAASNDVLPAQDNAHIERAGTQRWLVVNATPEQVWPVIRDFWLESGFIIDKESPATGVMETDWAEDRAKIPQDFVRRTLGKVLDGLYSTPERDKFRTRVEKGANGTTEIYVSHRGMEEVYDGPDQNRTVWQPRPSDPGLEAEMLRRLMVRFGIDEKKAEAMLAQPAATETARIVGTGDSRVLQLDDGFDQAWRRVGLALDRSGFVVEDRDRSQGIYYVRYVDPQVDNEGKKEEGVLSKLAFWKGDKKPADPSQKIRVMVVAAGAGSQVTIADAAAATRDRMLEQLHNELK